jgi:hypothetical protein
MTNNFRCDYSAIPMGLEAWQTSGKLTLLSGFHSAGGTSDCEHLFEAQFSFHAENNDMLLVGMLVNLRGSQRERITPCRTAKRGSKCVEGQARSKRNFAYPPMESDAMHPK